MALVLKMFAGAHRGLAVRASVPKRGVRGRGRARKGGSGRGGMANGTLHAHTNGIAGSEDDDVEASGSDAEEDSAE